MFTAQILTNPSFFHNFFSTISNYSNSPIIIGGNFNTVINPSVDRSSTSYNKCIWHSTKTIKQFMSDFAVGNSWRLQHPSAREYSFFFTGSPLIFAYQLLPLQQSIISYIANSKIHPIIISDHGPVTFTWNTISPHKPNTRRDFNTSLHKDPEFDSLIKKEWASFLEINDSPKSSLSILWETGKK